MDIILERHNVPVQRRRGAPSAASVVRPFTRRRTLHCPVEGLVAIGCALFFISVTNSPTGFQFE